MHGAQQQLNIPHERMLHSSLPAAHFSILLLGVDEKLEECATRHATDATVNMLKPIELQ